MSRSLSPSTRVGELDERVEFQKEVFTPDTTGGQTSVWETQFTAWAHVRSLTGGERMANDALAATGGYRIAIRNRSDFDVRANWRARWRGRSLNIRFPEYNGPRDIFLVMQTDSGVAT